MTRTRASARNVGRIENRCECCHARPGEPCRNVIHPDQPLPGRDMHYCRALPPNQTSRTRKAKSA